MKEESKQSMTRGKMRVQNSLQHPRKIAAESEIIQAFNFPMELNRQSQWKESKLHCTVSWEDYEVCDLKSSTNYLSSICRRDLSV